MFCQQCLHQHVYFILADAAAVADGSVTGSITDSYMSEKYKHLPITESTDLSILLEIVQLMTVQFTSSKK